MQDDLVYQEIQKGEEKLIQPQSQYTPTDYYPPKKGNSHQVTKSDKGWFLTDQGSFFVQLLNSKLEKIIDTSTEIEKTCTDQCLRFSFQRKTCRVFLTFPQDFPSNSSLEIMCVVPGASDPLKWLVTRAQLSAEFVDRIFQLLKESVPTVHHGPTKYVKAK